MEETFIININGEIYKFLGYPFAECVHEAIELHVEEDKEFSEYISVTIKEDPSFCELIYSPAILCAYNIIEKTDLYNFLIKSAVPDLIQKEA